MPLTIRLAVMPRAVLLISTLLLAAVLVVGAAIVGSAIRLGTSNGGQLFALPPTGCPAGTTPRSGDIVTIAGDGTRGAAGDDGPATAAQLSLVAQGGGDVVVDPSGIVYVSDAGTAKLRRIGTDGTITTIPAPATGPRPIFPFGLAIDASGNLFIADPGNLTAARIWKVDPSGAFTVVAGTGVSGSSGNEGPATAAQVAPISIAVGAHDDLYFDDLDDTYRTIDPAGIIHLFAGNGTQGFGGDDGPATAATLDGGGGAGTAVDAAGGVYLADAGNHRIRHVDPAGKITTFAGSGEAVASGDGGAAILAGIGRVDDLALDTTGDLYFLDGDTVRRIDAAGTITTIAGDGTRGSNGDCGPATSARLNQPIGLTARDGYVYVADAGNQRIRVILP